MGEGKRYVALDGLRGVFALAVALYHFYAGEWMLSQPWYAHLFLLVDFFFVLSGFVIWTAYGDRIRDTPATAGFLIKRFGRLWPLHVAVLAGLLVLELAKLAISMVTHTDTAAFSGTTDVPSFFASLALVQALGMFDAPVWNGPSWSISVELFAYVVFAFIAMAPKRAQLLTLGVLATSLVIVIASGEYLMGAARSGFPRCLVGFSIGVLVAMASRTKIAGYTGNVATLMEGAACIAVIVVLGFTSSLPATLWALPVFAFGVWVFAFEGGAVSRVLSLPMFRYLGERSYAIYIVHFLVVRGLFRVGQTYEAATNSTVYVEHSWGWYGPHEMIWTLATPNVFVDILAYALYAGIVLAVAEIGYRWIERPWRRWFRVYGDRVEQRLRERRVAPIVAATEP